MPAAEDTSSEEIKNALNINKMHHTHTSKYNCYTFQRQLLFLDTCEVLYTANTEFVKQYDLVCRKCKMIIKKKYFVD